MRTQQVVPQLPGACQDRLLAREAALEQVVQKFGPAPLGRFGHRPLLGKLQGNQHRRPVRQQSVELARFARSADQGQEAGPGRADLQRIELASP